MDSGFRRNDETGDGLLMFESLSERLGGILDKLTKRGALSEADVNEAMREVRRALIEAVYREARAAGASRVYWTTHETNATAQALYDTLAERSGFIQYRKLF